MFNAYLYNGEQILIAEELEEQDTDVSGTIEIGEIKESAMGARDVVKIAKRFQGVEYAILAIENQEGIHYAMPIRVMGYDYYSYDKQYQEKKAEYKAQNKKLNGNEFLSGIKKTDRFLPVITLVLYYGEEPWDGPKCLCDLLDIPAELKEYVSDYPLHIIEIKDNNLKLNNQNNKDLFRLLSIIYDVKKSRAEREEEIKQYEAQREIDETVIDTIMSTTKVHLKSSKEGGRTMCTLWAEVKEDGRAKGREEGENKLSNLIQLLIAAGRMDDIAKATSDADAREKFYSEFGITDFEITD